MFEQAWQFCRSLFKSATPARRVGHHISKKVCKFKASDQRAAAIVAGTLVAQMATQADSASGGFDSQICWLCCHTQAGDFSRS